MDPFDRPRRPPRTIGAGAATVIAIALLLSGCVRSADPATNVADGPAAPTSKYISEVTSDQQPKLGGQLVYALPDDTNSWNPALAQWGSYSMTEARAIFDFLTTFDSDGKVKPYLAQSLDPNADFTSWTIKLRPGVTFTNGKVLDANTLMRIQQYMRASPIVGEALQYISGWKVVDDLTLQVSMSQPWPQFAAGLASQVGAIADPDWLVQNEGISAVGTGPFKIDHWDIGKRMELSRNPSYWRTDQWGNHFPYLDRLSFAIITDDSARASALRSGDVDVSLQSFANSDITSLKAAAEQGDFQVLSDNAQETAEDHIILNTAAAPFDDPNARLALAYATDQPDYLKTVTGGLNQPADSAYAPGSPWYNNVPYPTYDPVKAADLVAKVKAAHGGEFTFELMAQRTPEAMRVQQYLQDQWGKVGIKVVPVNVDQQAKIILTVVGNFQASVMQLFDSPSPANDCVFWRASGKAVGTPTLNFSRLNDPEMTKACDSIERSADPAQIKQLVGQVQQRIAQTVPYIWLSHTPRTIVANTRVVNLANWTLPDGTRGLDFIQGSVPLYQVWLKV